MSIAETNRKIEQINQQYQSAEGVAAHAEFDASYLKGLTYNRELGAFVEDKPNTAHPDLQKRVWNGTGVGIYGGLLHYDETAYEGDVYEYIAKRLGIDLS